MNQNANVVGADKQSIFGDTYSGVVSPWVPHVHPYPTRFHGPIYNYPVFGRPYRAQSFMVPGNYLNPNLAGLGADVVLPDVVITGDLNPWYKHPLFYGVLAAAALGVVAFAVAQTQAPRRARANKRKARRNSSLHARIARALGWKEAETKSFSLQSLRELVRPVDPALAQEITEEIQSGGYIVGPRRARRNAKRQPRCPVGTKVQSLVFSRSFFTPSMALEWAEKHGYSATKIDKKPGTLRVRQEPPSHFKAKSFRVIPFGHGIQATIGCPR